MGALSRTAAAVVVFWLMAGCELATGLNAYDIAKGGEPNEGGGGSGGEGGSSSDGGAGGMGPLTCDFSDDFDDGVISDLWQQSTDPDLSIFEDGELVFDVPGGPGKLASSVRTARFDVGGCAATVELVSAELDSLSFAHFEFFIDSENRAGFLLVGDELRFHHEVESAMDRTDTVYDPSQHRFLRIAHRNGEFAWSTSGDGQTWDLQRTHPSPLDATAMRVVLGTEVLPDNPGAPAYEVRFDDVSARAP
jgi:hypothetical protein